MFSIKYAVAAAICETDGLFLPNSLCIRTLFQILGYEKYRWVCKARMKKYNEYQHQGDCKTCKCVCLEFCMWIFESNLMVNTVSWVRSCFAHCKKKQLLGVHEKFEPHMVRNLGVTLLRLQFQDSSNSLCQIKDTSELAYFLAYLKLNFQYYSSTLESELRVFTEASSAQQNYIWNACTTPGLQACDSSDSLGSFQPNNLLSYK